MWRVTRADETALMSAAFKASELCGGADVLDAAHAGWIAMTAAADAAAQRMRSVDADMAAASPEAVVNASGAVVERRRLCLDDVAVAAAFSVSSSSLTSTAARARRLAAATRRSARRSGSRVCCTRHAARCPQDCGHRPRRDCGRGLSMVTRRR